MNAFGHGAEACRITLGSQPMPLGGTMRRLAVLLSVLVCATACTGQAAEPSQSSRTASGDALAWLRPEIASQALCQALSPDDWKSLFGAPVQQAGGGADAACDLTAGGSHVRLSLVKADPALYDQRVVAGRPATRVHGDFVAVAITSVAVDDMRSGWPVRPWLQVESADAGLRDRVLDRVVPVLAASGEPVPLPVGYSEIGYQHVPVSAHGKIAEAPLPLQVQQLCSLLADIRHIPAEQLRGDVYGSCTSDQPRIKIGIQVQTDHPVSAYTFQVAGRPSLGNGSSPVSVRLRDDLPYDLVVDAFSDQNTAKLAEQLVPALI